MMHAVRELHCMKVTFAYYNIQFIQFIRNALQ
jgi:hypothetical protein